MNTCRHHPLTKKISLANIVTAYLEKNAEKEARYLDYYRIQRNLAKAVEKSALAELPSGKRFSHQRRIPHSALVKGMNALSKVNLNTCCTFEDLHELVKTTLKAIPGIGELTIYDTAERLGAYLRLQPKHIYLHAGTREGTKALGLNHRAEKLSMSELPREFQKLRPEQIEDCLCIYKSELARIKSRLKK